MFINKPIYLDLSNGPFNNPTTYNIFNHFRSDNYYDICSNHNCFRHKYAYRNSIFFFLLISILFDPIRGTKHFYKMILLALIDISGTCIDGIQNGKETGIDCGGDCPACGKTSFYNISPYLIFVVMFGKYWAFIIWY